MVWRKAKVTPKNGMLRVRLVCMRCGWSGAQKVDPRERERERTCPRCGSNSIRVVKRSE